jgi:anhydro-N-acetylmuramic acid kinase
VGCHGQTIYHEGGVSTLQIGEAAVIAERLGVPVISDFRTADIAAGGQGAPLVPYVDYLLLRSRRFGRVALNIGGIANITAIPPGGKPEEVIAFDTGPGNMVIDALVQQYTKGRRRFDRGGLIAAGGEVDRALLDRLLDDPFFRRKPPKSAGREQYGAEFAAALEGAPQNLIATATVLTAATIATGIERFVRPRMPVDEIVASGGGAHNPQILAHLAGFLPGVAVATSEDHGISIDGKEAVAFAVLAHETWRRRPANLPSATGARHSAILGKIALPSQPEF